jgi:hypothetical protein
MKRIKLELTEDQVRELIVALEFMTMNTDRKYPEVVKRQAFHKRIETKLVSELIKARKSQELVKL